MSETSISEDFSRPALQRTELGPMMHDFAHRAYDIAEAGALTDLGRFIVPSYVADMCDFGNGLSYFVDEATHSPLLKDQRAALIAFVQEQNHRWSVEAPVELTTLPGGKVLEEGLQSGVHTPAHLYRLIDACETWGDYPATSYSGIPYGNTHKLDPEKFANRIVSPDFIRMLHELAWARNGFLGQVTTNSFGFEDGRPIKCFQGIGYRPDWPSIFEQNEEGTVIDFAAEFLQRKREALNAINTGPNLSLHSGGCPVRHATFKGIGAHALQYLDGRRPLNEGTSAITRAAQLVSNVMKARLAQ